MVPVYMTRDIMKITQEAEKRNLFITEMKKDIDAVKSYRIKYQI